MMDSLVDLRISEALSIMELGSQSVKAAERQGQEDSCKTTPNNVRMAAAHCLALIVHIKQHSTSQHSTAQHITAQHSTAHHSTAQYSHTFTASSKPIAHFFTESHATGLSRPNSAW